MTKRLDIQIKKMLKRNLGILAKKKLINCSRNLSKLLSSDRMILKFFITTHVAKIPTLLYKIGEIELPDIKKPFNSPMISTAYITVIWLILMLKLHKYLQFKYVYRFSLKIMSKNSNILSLESAYKVGTYLW